MVDGDPEADVIETAEGALSAHRVSERVLDEMERLLREPPGSLAVQKARAELLVQLAEARAWLLRPNAPH